MSLASKVTASKRAKRGEDVDDIPAIVPLGWTQEIVPYESAITIDAIRKEVFSLSPEKRPSSDKHITVYRFYSLPPERKNKEWRDHAIQAQYYDRTTMHHPKVLTLFPTPSKVFCNSLDGPFSTPMANTLENKEKVRIFSFMADVYRLFFEWFKGPRITVESLDESMYEQASEFCMQLFGQRFTKEQVRNYIFASSSNMFFVFYSHLV
jgi:hypothetical protein